jgi:hypothetical protein
MNTITIDGQEYEVLGDDLSAITHARLVSGKVVKSSAGFYRSELFITVPHDDNDETEIYPRHLEDFGITPLRLIPREPVSFELSFYFQNGRWHEIAGLDDGFASQGSPIKRFRCTEIIEGDTK